MCRIPCLIYDLYLEFKTIDTHTHTLTHTNARSILIQNQCSIRSTYRSKDNQIIRIEGTLFWCGLREAPNEYIGPQRSVMIDDSDGRCSDRYYLLDSGN